MSHLKIYITKSKNLRAENFNPRNYDPIFLFVQEKLKEFPQIQSLLIDDVRGGSTPPHFLFRKKYDVSIPFVKTSAICRDFINLNDLHFIHPKFHSISLKRSITKPYDLIFSMTGKFMGKAALCPPNIQELNMSQNSVVLKTISPYHSAFLCIFLNSMINREQIKGLYSITKQKYINQGKIQRLRVFDYKKEYEKDIDIYLSGLNDYYKAIVDIKNTISSFEKNIRFSKKLFDTKYEYKTKISTINKKMFTPQFYRNDFIKIINNFRENSSVKKLIEHDIRKGDEIGSDNYISEGIPFIKTSDFLNYGVDHNPNYYCSEAIYNEVNQDLHTGDILFTKDGKIGEIAIIEESAKIVICSGIVRLRAITESERYWLFLLLASAYGRIYFDKWTVIASTMAHLRKDFLIDFKMPQFSSELMDQYIQNLRRAFKLRKDAYHKIETGKKSILTKLYQIINFSVRI